LRSLLDELLFDFDELLFDFVVEEELFPSRLLLSVEVDFPSLLLVEVVDFLEGGAGVGDSSPPSVSLPFSSFLAAHTNFWIGDDAWPFNILSELAEVEPHPKWSRCFLVHLSVSHALIHRLIVRSLSRLDELLLLELFDLLDDLPDDLPDDFDFSRNVRSTPEQ